MNQAVAALREQEQREPLFELGRVWISREVMGRMVADDDFASFICISLERHARGDWGDVVDADKIENEISLDNNERLHSAYTGRERICPRIWIVTEKDRSKTTILFGGAY